MSGPKPILLRKLRPADQPVTPRSVALFRLGEHCNNACPMCSNSGRPGAFFHETDELVRRVEFLAAQGLRAVVVTGGEATIHPGFWTVVEALVERGVRWDINTNGRRFADPDFAARARELGLRRAIVSLHSHRRDQAREISGLSDRGFDETVQGIRNLADPARSGPVELMINCVLCRPNLADLVGHLRWCADELGPRVVVKYAFPDTLGKGGGWPGIDLRYRDVAAVVRALVAEAASLGVTLELESFPNCVLGDSKRGNCGRSGFGETHYLDDLSGRDLYSIQHIETQLSAYLQRCGRCAALSRCPGVATTYLERYGGAEFRPFGAR
ncbi:MAG: radical SAM protein [Myxococcota bacterium]